MLLAVACATTVWATDVGQLLSDLKARIAPDKRVAIWNVTTTMDGDVAIINGVVGYQEQLDAINAELDQQSVSYKNNVKVLASEEFVTEQELNKWKNAERYIVTVYDDRLVTEPKGDETVSDLVMGNILEVVKKKGKWIELATPDGRTGWLQASNVEKLDKWAQQNIDLKKIEKTARRMMGSSYLWGGTSTKVTDCSGLVKVSYFSNGIILQRDASQQALTGLKIDDWHDAQLCDLLFFGNSKTGRVTHVGLYLRDGKYIHCSGQVKVNDLNPDAPDYLYSPLSISRINGMIGTKGIVYVRDHNWYFKK